MTVLVTMDIPFSREMVEGLSERIGARENPPAGLLVHVLTETSDGVRVVDVWQSAQHFKDFQEGTLNPAIVKAMDEAGVPMLEQGPEPQISEAYDLVVGSS